MAERKNTSASDYGIEAPDFEEDLLGDQNIVGMAINREYARWAHRATNPEEISGKPEALLKHFGLTAEDIKQAAFKVIARKASQLASPVMDRKAPKLAGR